jgi:hypothetical protein
VKKSGACPETVAQNAVVSTLSVEHPSQGAKLRRAPTARTERRQPAGLAVQNGGPLRAADLARQASWPDVALLAIASALDRHLWDGPDAELVALGVSENDPLDAVPFAPAGLTVDRLVDK